MINMKRKMLQLPPFGVMAIWHFVARCFMLIVIFCGEKIDIILVLWSYLVIGIGDLDIHSGDQECHNWKIRGSTRMNGEEGQCMPPSQALRHSKLMRPDKHF